LSAVVALLSAAPAQTAPLDLLHRAANPNPTLLSYTATAQLSATLHALLPVHKTFTGTVYYLKPRRKIEFQNVSGPLSRFKDLASSMPTYQQLTTDYAITPLGETGTGSSYSLIPKKTGGRVQKIVMTIDDTLALVRHLQWLYNGGGKLDVEETYTTVGTFQLPAKADIEARFPGYSVNGTILFSGYKPNAPVSPSVFATPPA
jgi:hypothetical protein